MPGNSYRVGLTAAFIACGLSASTAQASWLASNFNSTSPLFTYFSFATGGGDTVTGSDFGSDSGHAYAVGFTPTITENFDFADLPLRGLQSPTGGPVTAIVDLQQDNNGLPGAVIESMVTPEMVSQYDNGLASSDLYSTVFSTLQPELTAGTPYWLSVSITAKDTSAIWLYNNINEVSSATNAFAYEAPLAGAGWFDPSPGNVYEIPAFEVYGSPVPEPASLSVAAIGLIALRRRPPRAKR